MFVLFIFFASAVSGVVSKYILPSNPLLNPEIVCLLKVILVPTKWKQYQSFYHCKYYYIEFSVIRLWISLTLNSLPDIRFSVFLVCQVRMRSRYRLFSGIDTWCTRKLNTSIYIAFNWFEWGEEFHDIINKCETIFPGKDIFLFNYNIRLRSPEVYILYASGVCTGHGYKCRFLLCNV